MIEYCVSSEEGLGGKVAVDSHNTQRVYGKDLRHKKGGKHY